MNFRENVDAILHYRPYERMPVVAFGFWKETVQKWMNEGVVSREIGEDFRQNGHSGWSHRALMDALGFDFDWGSCIGNHVLLRPAFEQKELEVCADNERGLRLYKKFDFVEYGRCPRAMRRSHGEYMDEILMVRSL